MEAHSDRFGPARSCRAPLSSCRCSLTPKGILHLGWDFRPVSQKHGNMGESRFCLGWSDLNPSGNRNDKSACVTAHLKAPMRDAHYTATLNLMPSFGA